MSKLSHIDNMMFSLCSITDNATRPLEYYLGSAIRYIAWNHQTNRTYKYVVTNGKLYVTDGKQQTKPVAFFNSMLQTEYPDLPLLDAVSGKAFAEKLVDCAIIYAAQNDLSNYALRFTYDIAATYQHADNDSGLHSCMSAPAEHYESNIHPCTVYEREINRRVMLAYMLDKADDNRIVARGLVDIQEGRASRLYYTRDTARALFIELLDCAGFAEYDAALIDCTFPVIKQKRFSSIRAVFPYLDRGTLTINDDETLFRIIGENDNAPRGFSCVDAYSTSGVICLTPMVVCDCCGEHVDEDDAANVDGNIICRDCLDNEYTYSEHVGEYIRNDDGVYSDYHSDFLPSDDCVYSECLEDYILSDESVEVELTIDGGTVLNDYVPSDYSEADTLQLIAANINAGHSRLTRRRYR